ncbi:MAG TPA: DUF4244 domain-containing protein [Acidimicrobiales bacterium]|nr:DUF4244 domain-containing protein [Acidimicrobiales bacterium]
MLRTLVSLQVLVLSTLDGAQERIRRDDGQSTAEYALVLLGAAGVAALLIAWATKSNRITGLLNTVLDQVISKVS